MAMSEIAGISSQAQTTSLLPSAHVLHGAPQVLVHHSLHSWVSPRYEQELPTGSRIHTAAVLMAGISSQAQTEPSAISQAEHGAPQVLVHHSEHCCVTPKYEHELPSALIQTLASLNAGTSSQAQTTSLLPSAQVEHGAPQVLVHHSEHSWVSPKYEHELPTGSRIQTAAVLMAGKSSQAQTAPSSASHDEHGAPQFSVHQTEHCWVAPR